ncbi:hypothetical protein SISSUDRAFT_1050118 [Sistotremastrum suecicum HHB10207 ss-3]|nr:hypothetical protein SISSUDRAFT_1050118 [Sistotremastrum suecicum HHB10207 ss-3]
MSQEPNPFSFCPIGSSGDLLSEKYGVNNLARSRLHAGSGARVQKVLKKAMSGLPITISVLGGSISACHGAGDDPIAPGCWPARLFNWWNEVFPHPASELTNGAMRKTDSSYYAFCNSHHVPDHTDLVILEFDSDDPAEAEWRNHFELLMRSLLTRPDQPAVLVLGHFSPHRQAQYGYHGAEVLHSSVAQFYDVPHISTKPTLYAPYISDPSSIRSLYADPLLANPAGHGLLSDMLVSYFQSQICTVWNSLSSPEALLADTGAGAGGIFGGAGQRKGDVDAGAGAVKAAGAVGDHPNFAGVGALLDTKVPPFMLTTRPEEFEDFREAVPFCVSANDLINPLPPSLFYGSGWHAYHPSQPKDGDQTHYWYSTLPTSRLRVPVRIGAGDVGIYYMQEPRSGGASSAAECWVDDNYGGAVAIGNGADIDQARPGLKIIDRKVAAGSHFVECELLGEEGHSVPAFKILGVFAT